MLNESEASHTSERSLAIAQDDRIPVQCVSPNEEKPPVADDSGQLG